MTLEASVPMVTVRNPVGIQNLRGLYIEFAHDRPADWDFLRRWQPSVVRLKVNGSHTDPNSISIDRIQRLHDATGARILIRCWDVDDRRGDGNPGVYGELQAAPLSCAIDYHMFWSRFMDRLPAALRDQCWAGAINEPHPDLFPQTFEFTDKLLDLGTRDGVGYGVYMFSVGTPPLPSEHNPWGWQKFAQFDDRIADGGHAAVVHEYMQPEGMYAVWTDDSGRERRDYGYLVGRHLSSGLTRAPIIIGEWGIEGLIYNRHPDPAHGGHSGWLNFRETWGPERYADEYVECIRQAAPNVIAICPFGSDIPDRNHTWNSFDVMPAYGALLSRKELCVKPAFSPAITHTINLPVISQPGPTPPTAETPEPQPPAPGQRNPARADYLVLFRRYGLAYGVPWNILAALAYFESAYNPQAISSAGAQGMMQFMPGTFGDMMQAIGVTSPWEPEQAIRATAFYLNQIRNYLPVDRRTWDFILAGYNAGPGRAASQPWESLPPETRRYARDIQQGAEMLRRWEESF